MDAFFYNMEHIMMEERKETLVELKHIHKEFPGVKVLEDISVAFYPGEVHVLLGENGAGKSTIIKIISGIYQPDKGEVLIEGQPGAKNIREAQQRGISVIHQELSVIEDLKVYENVFLGREEKKSGFLNKEKMIAECKRILDEMDVAIDPRSPVYKLSNGEKQMVEIARAVSQNSKLVIMDEPTSSLSDHEVQSLFRVIRQLKKDNVAVIYISHRLKEILEMGDMLTVLRDGMKIATVPVSTVTEQKMVEMMVGREISQFYYKAKAPESKELVLEVKNLCSKNHFKNVSFQLYKGEVLGVAGLIGAGRTELMRAIFGADSYDSGEVFLYGESLKGLQPKEIIKKGMGLIPEDRRGQGLLLEKTVRENTSLASLKENSHSGFIDFSWEKREAISYIDKLRIKTPSDSSIIKNLSGGNQQKVVIAKWLLAKSKILIMDEPTRGIDVNAKAEIYELMKNFVEEGGSIILVSSELPEVLGCSNRIMVMREGYVTGFLDSAEATEENVMLFASKGNEEVVYE